MIQTQFSAYHLDAYIKQENIEQNATALETATRTLMEESGKGNDFLGWLTLPAEFDAAFSNEIRACADRLAAMSQLVVVIGIGGSYLGARAVIEALQHSFNALLPRTAKKRPDVVFAGNNISEDYLHDLIDLLGDRDFSLVVISKSGTTTEPALAFRVLKEKCEQKYGKADAAQRIVAVTDQARGALKKLASAEGYQTFVIPDNVGGRYSVLTPVGLLPIAIAGFDIDALVSGAEQMRQHLFENTDFQHNIAKQYALYRYLLYQQGKGVELMVAYEPRLANFIEWYKQLFGESEGKEKKGIFPAGAIFSTDLHSLGQYIQEGAEPLFETVISVKNAHHRVAIPYDEADIDGMNYLKDKTIQEVNLTAEEGTRLAHDHGGRPNLRIEIPEINEKSLGELIYFFEYSCAVSGYLLGINPFDQPGVEIYKRNMFQLLGKPGVKMQ